MIKTKNNSQIIITIALAIIAIAILTGALCTTSYPTVSAEQSAGAVENLPTESDNVPAIEQNVLATNNNDYYMGDTQVLILINWNGTSSWEDATTYTITTNVVYYKKVKQLGFSIQSTVENFAEINEFVKKSPTVIGKAYPYDSIGIELRNIKVVSEESRIRFNQLDVEMTIDDNGFDYVEIYLELPKYKITWDSNGGHYTDNWQALNPRDYVPGNFFYLAPYPSKDGYNCIGWEYNGKIYTYAQVNENNYVFTDRNDLSFIAKYEVITYTITYKNIATMHQSSSGVNILKLRDNSQTYTIDNTPYALLSLDTDAYRETAGGIPFYTNGYDTIGWIPEEYVTVGDNTITYDKTQAITELALGTYGNKTFYRVFEPHYYEIFYDWNGGSYDNWQAGSFPSSFSPVMEIDIKSTPFRTGYEFIGFKVDGTDTIITEGKQKLNYTHDITLIAQWQAINYTITYKTYGIANNTLFIEIERNYANYTIENTPLTLQSNPEKDAVTLVSWIPSDCVTITDNGIITYDKTKAISVIEEGTYGDRTFYAFYEPIYYQITYDWNGGRYENWQVGSFPSSFSPLVEVNINSAGPPSRNAYKFTGWKVDGTDTIITEGKQFLNYTNDITLIAQWKPLKYTISYKYINLFNEIIYTPHKNASYTIEDNVSMDNVLKSMTGFTGRDFHYWIPSSYINIVDGNKVTLDEGYSTKAIKSWNAGEQIGDLTFYAVAYYINYTITYLLNSEPVQFNTGVRTSYTYPESKNEEIPLPDMSTIARIKMPSSEFNYICVGWYANENLSGNAVQAISLNSSSNKVYYLKIKDTATVTYKVLYGKDAGYDDPDIQYIKEHNVGELFTADYIYTSAYKKRGGFYSIIIFFSVVNEYIFKGWSLEESTYKEWDKGECGPLVKNGDFAYTEDTTLYAVFEKTKQNYAYEWIWNTSFRIDVDNTMKNEMTKEVAYGKHNVVFSYIIDYANDRNVTEIYHSYTTEADNTTLVLPNTEDFEKSIEDTIFGVNYKFVGWTLWQPEVNIYMLSVWDSIRYKDDFSKYSMNVITTQEEADEIKVTGNMALIGVFVKVSVWNSWFSSSDNAKPFPDKDNGEEEPSSIISVLSSFFGIDMTSKGFQDFLKFFRGKLSLKEAIESYTWVKIVVIVIGIAIGISIIAFIAKIIIAIKNAKAAKEVYKMSKQIKQKEPKELKENND